MKNTDEQDIPVIKNLVERLDILIELIRLVLKRQYVESNKKIGSFQQGTKEFREDKLDERHTRDTI